MAFLDEKSSVVPTPAEWQLYRDEKHKFSIACVLETMTVQLKKAIRDTCANDVALWLPWSSEINYVKYTDRAMRRAVDQHFGAAGWDVLWCDDGHF